MKKNVPRIPALTALAVSIFFLAVIASASSALDASAAEGIAQNVETARDRLPTNPDDIKNTYLTQEWSAFIAKTPVLGTLHAVLLKQTIFFKIVFNTSYEFSLTFLGIFILWCFVAYHAAKIVAASGVIPRGGTVVIGLAAAVLFAQISLYNILVSAALQLVRSNDYWAARIVIGIVLLGLLALAWYGSTFFERYLKQCKAAAQQAALKQNVAESAAFLKGVREGQAARGNKARRLVTL